MSFKRRSVPISKLAQYASNPSDVFKKIDSAKARHGNRAHDAVGSRRASNWLIIIIGAAVAAYLVMGGL